MESPPVTGGHHRAHSLAVVLVLALFHDRVGGNLDDGIDKDDTRRNFNLYLQNRMRCQELPELWIAVPNCCFDHLNIQKHSLILFKKHCTLLPQKNC